MALFTVLCKYYKLILTLSVVIFGIIFRVELQSFYNSFKETSVAGPKLKNVFSNEELSQYNGIEKKRLYLAVMGSVFDVTKGKQHYGEDGSYNYFVGKDGSRALVTGDFKDESSTKDHVVDLSCDELMAVYGWKDTLRQKYKPVGVLIGRYYDKFGKPTEYSKQVELKIENCKLEKEQVKLEERKYPPCNMEWSADQGSRVWCTKSSGGVSRDWVGVPRQLYTPGEAKPRCVCVNLQRDNSLALLKEYDNCKPDSVSCIVGS